MKHFIVIIIALFLISGGSLIGCSDVDEYEIVMPEGHVTYMISRQGEFFSKDRFDVIFVFGHNNNKLIAKEITNYLNKKEPGASYQFRRFLPDENIKGPQ
jgi:hypothetical protein